MVENNVEITIPFLKSNVPIAIPNSPVVKSRIIVSCTLTIVKIIAEEKNTAKPSVIFKTAANAIGSVLNGLKASPIAGKNIGADWNSTATVVKIPPIHISLLILNFFNLGSSNLLLIKSYRYELWNNFKNSTLVKISHIGRAINT